MGDAIEESADVEAIEAVFARRWMDPAWSRPTADEAAGFAVWLPNIPLRQEGLLFVPRARSTGSWAAISEDLARFLYPLIGQQKYGPVVGRALERFGYACGRVDDASIGERGPWAYLLDPLLELFFRDGKYVNPRAFLPYSGLRVFEAWPEAHPFEREERQFTIREAAMLTDRFAQAGFTFLPNLVGDMPWVRLVGQLVAYALPHLADSHVRAIMAQLLSDVRQAVRGEVGELRARTLVKILLSSFNDDPTHATDAEYYGPDRVDRINKLRELLPEYASELDELFAASVDQRRQEEGGY